MSIHKVSLPYSLIPSFPPSFQDVLLAALGDNCTGHRLYHHDYILANTNMFIMIKTMITFKGFLTSMFIYIFNSEGIVKRLFNIHDFGEFFSPVCLPL